MSIRCLTSKSARPTRLVQVLFSTLVAFGLLATAAASQATAATNGWGSGSSAPSMKDLIPNPKDAEAYSERYDWTAKLDGGGRIKVNLTISNLGWGDRHGAAEVEVNLPDREKYKYQKKVGSDEWSYSKDKFKLQIADTTVEGVGDDTFRLKHDGKVKVRMEMTSKIPMWQPGGGKIKVSDGYYKLNVTSLRSTAKGKVYIDGEWREFTATRSGYGDHVATNLAPYNLAKRFSYSRIYDDENNLFILWREIKLTEDYGGKSVAFVMVGYKDQIVFEDPDADMKMGRVRHDPKVGYRLPYAVQFNGEDGDDSIKLVLKAKDMKRKDLLASYGAAVKAIASSVSEPFHYYFPGQFALQMDIKGSKATVRSEKDVGYVFDYINK